jgi:hypothetical protein
MGKQLIRTGLKGAKSNAITEKEVSAKQYWSPSNFKQKGK